MDGTDYRPAGAIHSVSPIDSGLMGRTMVELTSALSEGRTNVEGALTAVTQAAVRLMDGVDFADVLLIDDGEFQSVTPTSALAVHLDNEQRRLGEGPCLDAINEDPLIRAPDMRTETRWPQFADVAVRAGVHSMLSFHLFTHHSGSGALNLFGREAGGFDAGNEAVGAMLATHAAIVLMSDDRQTQFQSALASRDVIGQAKGMIMERFKVDAARAFELLVRLSQDSNTPLREVAEKLTASATG